MAITVTQSSRVSGALFGGTNTYTLTTLTALSADQGIVVAITNSSLRNVSTVVLSSSGTTTSLTELVSISGVMALWYGTASGNETNADVVVTLSGNANDTEMVAALVASGWSSDQSGAVSTSESSASAMSHDIGPLTPPTANNLFVFATSRGNRDWTDDADYTLVNDIVNTHAFAYRIQSAADADTYSFSTTDANGAADMLYAAFAGTADGGDPEGSLIGGKLLRGGLLMHGVLGR